MYGVYARGTETETEKIHEYDPGHGAGGELSSAKKMLTMGENPNISLLELGGLRQPVPPR